MDLSGLIEDHGYLGLVLGSLIEGETFVVLAGFAAYRGYLSLPLVIVVATVMNFAWDQLYFWIGRRLRPESGDCCVFCSYGNTACPPVQEQRGCCGP